MKKTRTLAEKAISSLLAPHGFAKNGSVWTLELPGSVLGVQLQGSRFAAGRAYLNFLAWYPALSAQPHSGFRSDFHLSFRGDDAHAEAIQAALTFDGSETELHAYASQLDTLFFAASLQRLLRLSTLDAAIAAVRADTMRGYSLALWNAAYPDAAAIP